jgi:Flp pilus assembly pilin Flp
MLKYLRSCDGASSAEYAMLLGMVGGLMAIALFVFGAAVAERIGSSTDILASGGAPPTGSPAGPGSGPGQGAGASNLGGGNGAAHANGGNGIGGGSGGGRGDK